MARRISTRRLRQLGALALSATLLLIVIASITIRTLSGDLPSPAELQSIRPAVKTLIFAADGDTLHEYFRQNRVPIRLEEVPQGLVDAILATEDRNFRQHYGVELRGAMRAVFANLRTGRRTQGGSTLTMQLARSLFLHHRKEWTRKIREVLLALQIERTYTKDEILEMYMNTIYFGPAYGVEAASVAFFGKSVRELEPPEYTLLAGVLNNPGLYDPRRHSERSYQRRGTVLKSMVVAGILSSEAAEEIGKTKVAIRQGVRSERLAPYLVESIRQYLESHYGVKQLYEEGLRVYTSLDTKVQRAAEDALEAHLRRLEAAERYDTTWALYDSVYAGQEEAPLPDYIQASLLLLDARTGDIKALVGGRDFEHSKFNRVFQAQRQPGSVFKPFLYVAALERNWHPGSVLLDAPIEINTGSDELYRPVNYDNTFRGPMSIRDAIANSVNIPAVRLIQEVGPQAVIQRAKRMGIRSHIPEVPSIALGSAECNLGELVSAYTAFANGGIRTRPRLFTRIENSAGELLEELPVYQEEVLDERINWVMVDMMRTALLEGSGRSARNFGFTREGAGKTGTTDLYTDAWFLGFTPDLVCGVWVGFDKQRSMGRRMTGSAVALPIWAPTMVAASKGPEHYFGRPDGIVEGLICQESGQRPAPACQHIRLEVFIEGMEPSRTCEIHQPSATNTQGQAADFESLDEKSSRSDEFDQGDGR